MSKYLKSIKTLTAKKRERLTTSGLVRNSKTYSCTLDLTCESDLDILTKIRHLISDHNLYFSPDKKLKVITKPVKSFSRNIRDENRNLVGGLDNARIIDVYIY